MFRITRDWCNFSQLFPYPWAGGAHNPINDNHEQDSKLFAMDRQKRRSNRSIARYDHC